MIFHVFCGLEALYKFGDNRNKKLQNVPYLLAMISKYDKRTIANDFYIARRKYRNFFAHGSEEESVNAKNSLYDLIAFQIRLLDYLRLSILLFLHLNLEEQKILLECMGSNQQIPQQTLSHIKLDNRHIEENVDKNYVTELINKTNQLLSKATPYRHHEFLNRIFSDEKFKKTLEIILPKIIKMLKEQTKKEL